MKNTKNSDKSETYQKQLNELLKRCKKGYVEETAIFEKIEVVKKAGYKIGFEVNRFFELEDFEIDEFGISITGDRIINISFWSILKIFVSKLID